MRKQAHEAPALEFGRDVGHGKHSHSETEPCSLTHRGGIIDDNRLGQDTRICRPDGPAATAQENSQPSANKATIRRLLDGVQQGGDVALFERLCRPHALRRLRPLTLTRLAARCATSETTSSSACASAWSISCCGDRMDASGFPYAEVQDRSESPSDINEANSCLLEGTENCLPNAGVRTSPISL